MGGLHNSIKILFSLFDLDPVLVQSDLSQYNIFDVENTLSKPNSNQCPSSGVLWDPTFLSTVDGDVAWTVNVCDSNVSKSSETLKSLILKTIFLCGWKTEWRGNIYWCRPPLSIPLGVNCTTEYSTIAFRPYSIQNWH